MTDVSVVCTDPVPEDRPETLHLCSSVGCNKPAVLACPSCLKLGLPPSRFCGQECFTASWSVHKAMHKDVKKARIDIKTDPTAVPSEFRGFAFTGNLRPAQLSATRIVPEGIMRPDYADHAIGLPLSENEDKRKGSPMKVDNNHIQIIPGSISMVPFLSSSVIETASSAFDIA